MIIDNVGFDVQAMAGLTEAEFIKIHIDTPAICQYLTKEVKIKWLKNAYKAIKEKAKSESGGTDTSKAVIDEA